MKKEIILIGSGGHAAELTDYLKYYNKLNPTTPFIAKGYIDDSKEGYNHYKFDAPFLGSIKEHVIDASADYLMAIANLKFRREIILDFEAKGANIIGFIHPLAQISSSAEVAKGVVISHNSSLGPKVKIGAHTLINSRCTIGHDSVIGEFNFLSPAISISGNTVIGNNNLIGTGVITIPSTKIGDNNKIGAGVTLFFNVENNTTIVGQKPRIFQNAE